MKKLFGTDGIRGKANVEPMTVETMVKVGRAAAYVLSNNLENTKHPIVIGKDTRISGYMLESALVSGICSMGMDVLLTGPLPTPGVAFITRSLRATAGVMISASHNAYYDNGIKFFQTNGFKLPDSTEEEIERLVASGELDSIRPTAKKVGKAYRMDTAVGRYMEFAKSSFPKGMTLDGLKIVVDCANGAAYKVGPGVLRELGAEVIVIGAKPDGTNINDEYGALHPEKMRVEVIKNNADIGIALDGDADRAIFSDENGNEVDGDLIMGLIAVQAKKEGILKNNTLVTTIMSNLGLDLAMKKHGIDVVKTAVGDRHVVEEMRKNDFCIGGEQSGHMVFLEHNTTGDGLVSALQVLATMVKTKSKLSKLSSVVIKLPQVLKNVNISEKKPLEELPTVIEKIAEVEEKLNGKGRVLVRYSGTENLLRVMLEGEDEVKINIWATDICNEIKKEIGA
ncbi:MAG: phosphoglucosamine mutase [Candidatus Cloacimonadota bacterium]|nr:MAG: phosphoglucosamine mutase [Candidatus Cloacimonadota bacterium]